MGSYISNVANPFYIFFFFLQRVEMKIEVSLDSFWLRLICRFKLIAILGKEWCLINWLAVDGIINKFYWR